jgi:predicted O-linked N-acetylglucosamine transferase (SPINDLY family)
MTINKAIAPDQSSPLAGILERARRQQMPLGELVQIAENLSSGGLRALVVDLYRTWIAYNDANPLLHLACFNYSVAARQNGDIAGAIQALRHCLKLNPQFGPAHINLGRALEESGLAHEAVQQWRSFVDVSAEVTADRISHRLISLQQIGRVLEGAGALEEAEAALWHAIELQPDKVEAAQHWSSLRQRQCKWPVLTGSAHVSPRQLLDGMSSMALAAFTDDPLFLLARAYRYSKNVVGRIEAGSFPRPKPRRKSGTGQRLRVGYLSSDLREHAVGFALCEALELHDKGRIEVFAYYTGEPRTNDATHERIKTAVDCWRDIRAVGDAEAAAQIVADEIDILVDLNGYTKQARTRIFAYRPAPVIANFCGFPGSMGSPFHQYIIADGRIIPPGSEIYYSEKVLRLACYLPCDGKQVIPASPTRKDAGLPEDAFVYACLNGMQKITATCFTRWMAILSATPGSVLWLRPGNEGANQRLRAAAAQSGVAPERLIFAPSVSGHANHIARMGAADLFLDTFPYGAHATATDALTAGLPVLTVPGKSFATRVCASIVAAAGVPDLICSGPDEYIGRAIAFAHDRQRLAAVQESLQQRRASCTLHDTPAFVRRLEEQFWQMQGEAERGETPQPNLRNLDLYYEIGANFVLANVEFEDDHAYRQRYLEKLAEWNDYAPLERDGRLWGEPPVSAAER